MALLLGAGLLVLALLAAFAVALADNQASSKADIKSRVHERAVLAAALVESLFSTIAQQIPTDAKTFGGAQVSNALLEHNRGANTYLVLLGADGRLLAASNGLSSRLRAQLPGSRAVQRVRRRGTPYALGDIEASGKTALIDVVAGLPTAHGRRLLVQGTPVSALAGLLTGELDRIPGVAGSRNLIVDSNDAVIASNVASWPPGHKFSGRGERAALGHSTGDRNGQFYDQIPLRGSTWRMVLASPDGALFASLSGLHRWVPWLLLIAFGLVASVALLLGWRMLSTAQRGLAEANVELEAVNHRLAASNRRLERRAQELARSNAELDQFASIASHDLQEPLRKVRTFTEQLMASESGRLSERGSDYLMRANRAAERMQALIQDLLQFSRVTTKPRPFARVDMNELTAEVLEDMWVELEDAGAVVSVGELPTLSADAPQMRQLLVNLVSNALKFRRSGVRPEITISGESDGHDATIVVADNGIGFEPQYAERIFRVFERLNGRGEYPGTGIGLALCQKIATRHGGGIVADGTPGAGATFTVTLPLEHSEPILEGDGTDRPETEVEEGAHVAG
jgi:signal transduction histidine kinase